MKPPPPTFKIRLDPTAATHWKVEADAISAGLEKQFGSLSAPLQSRGIKFFADRKVKEKQLDCVDHSFLDEVPTDLELLDGCEHIYIREATESEQNLADRLKKTKKEAIYEILDHDGFRLYFVRTKSTLSTNERRAHEDRFEFTWYDYHGHEIIGTSGKIEPWCNCSGEVRIVLPSEHPEDDTHIGTVETSGCCCCFRCRPRFKLTTHGHTSYHVVGYKGKFVLCQSDEQSLEEFEIIDPDDNDLVGTVFKLHCPVDFTHHAKLPVYNDSGTRISPIIDFNGFAIYFKTSELGAETKAMLVCGAFLLNENYFQPKEFCNAGFCYTIISVLLVLSIFAFGALGLLSYFKV